MRNTYRCFSDVVFLWLLIMLPTTSVYAQAVPATAASTSSPYSPIVSFGTLPALQVTTPIPNSTHAPGDFNGDGISDLLWFNPALSQVGYWTMVATTPDASSSNGTVTRTGLRSFNVTSGYYVGAVGDFNNDGYADLVFTSANRDLWLWTNNQRGGWTSTKIGTYPSQWQLIGAGDIDGDGYDDLLWLDPSECKFGYWTMKGAVQTGYKIIDIACGYYPISIGYYSPSNRLSILWTSPANDVYIWDSTTTGFKSYNLTASLGYYLGPNVVGPWAMGGGVMGRHMGFITFADNNGFTTAEFTRTFDAKGNQTNFVRGSFGSGGVARSTAPASYLIDVNDMNVTGLYAINPTTSLLTTPGLPDDGLPTYINYSQWTYPAGWYVVGAPANMTAIPPWQ